VIPTRCTGAPGVPPRAAESVLPRAACCTTAGLRFSASRSAICSRTRGLAFSPPAASRAWLDRRAAARGGACRT
jgi:hypothetical protein